MSAWRTLQDKVQDKMLWTTTKVSESQLLTLLQTTFSVLYTKTTTIDFSFDKSSDLTILYANPKYDVSDEILDEMGFKNTSSDDGDSGTNGGSGSGTGDKK